MLPAADFLTEIRYTLDEIDEPMKPAAAEALKVILEGSLSDLATGLRLETGRVHAPRRFADFATTHRRVHRNTQTVAGENRMALEISQIDHVSVLVTDLTRSRRFYRDVLGLKEIAKPRTFDFKVLVVRTRRPATTLVAETAAGHAQPAPLRVACSGHAHGTRALS